MPLAEIKTLNEIIRDNEALGIQGNWVCINIETDMPWPVVAQQFLFESHAVWLIPRTKDHFPGLALSLEPSQSQDDGWACLYRALSTICWSQRSGAVISHQSRGNLPRMMGTSSTNGIILNDEFDLTDLPNSEEPRAGLALALMREGRGLNHPAYSFLSFYRVLEVAIPNASDRGDWVASAVSRLPRHEARTAVERLTAELGDRIGEHLRESGRHAIAHARSDPVINPDEPRDARRLVSERPIIEGLAELAIEENLGIQTARTIFRERLYELRGWKAILGQELIEVLRRGEIPSGANGFDAPEINFRLRKRPSYEPFERMQPFRAGVIPSGLEMVYRSNDERVWIKFKLNFDSERIEFDIERDIRSDDDGSREAALAVAEVLRFNRDYYLNGEIQIWDANSDKLLSRCDAFRPVNIYLDLEGANSNIERWLALAGEREDR